MSVGNDYVGYTPHCDQMGRYFNDVYIERQRGNPRRQGGCLNMALWIVLSGAYLRHFSASVHDHGKQRGHREDGRRGYPGGRGPVGEEVVLDWL